MGALRVVFIILSVLSFLTNVLGYIGLVASDGLHDYFTPAGLVGYNFFFLLSGLFAFLSWKVSKRIERKKAAAFLDALVNESVPETGTEARR